MFVRRSIPAALSLSLLLTALAISLRGALVHDTLTFTGVSRTDHSILKVQVMGDWDGLDLHVHRAGTPTVWFATTHEGLPHWRDVEHQSIPKPLWRPFRKPHLAYSFGGSWNGDFHLGLPLWPLYALGLVYPAVALHRASRRRRRHRAGLCPHCGYDLRHSPALCPECGRGTAVECRAPRPIRLLVAFLTVPALIVLAPFAHRAVHGPRLDRLSRRIATDHRLLESIRLGEHDATRALLAAGADPAAPFHNLTALHVAAMNYQAAAADALLAAGVAVDGRDHYGRTPLQAMCEYRGAGPFKRPYPDAPKPSWPPATPEQITGVAARLLSHGADANVNAPYPAYPPLLISALLRDNESLVRALLAHGADPNSPRYRNLTPAEWCADRMPHLIPLFERRAE